MWWSRRRWVLAALGVLLTVGSGLAVLVLSTGSGGSRELLVAARSIPAGHVIERADLRAVSVVGAEDVSAVRSGEVGQLLGRAASVPVAAGALIPADVVRGAGVLPPPGQVLLSIAVGPGVVPPMAGPGAAVRVLSAPLAGTQPAPAAVGKGWDAVLVDVRRAGSGETSVVSLQVAEADAAALAAAGDAISVVVLSGPR